MKEPSSACFLKSTDHSSAEPMNNQSISMKTTFSACKGAVRLFGKNL